MAGGSLKQSMDETTPDMPNEQEDLDKKFKRQGLMPAREDSGYLRSGTGPCGHESQLTVEDENLTDTVNDVQSIQIAPVLFRPRQDLRNSSSSAWMFQSLNRRVPLSEAEILSQ